jgi:hypothetical protein
MVYTYRRRRQRQETTMGQPFQPSGIRLGIARGITYGLFGPPGPLVAPIRELGAGLVRVYVYWSQVEPEPGRFDWTVVDALLDQLDGAEEVWVTVCSSSRWATQQSTDFLPPSPATDNDDYHRFVHALVTRCDGRVQYWQCNNEPSNVGLLWAGTAAEYVAQVEVLDRAVRHADPSAAVVLGGCGYDVLSSGPDGPHGDSSTTSSSTAAMPSTCSPCTSTTTRPASRCTSRRCAT